MQCPCSSTAKTATCRWSISRRRRRLPFRVRRVAAGELPQIEEAAFERPPHARLGRNERIDFADQDLDVAGMRQQGHGAGGPRPVCVARVERRGEDDDRNVPRTRGVGEPRHHVERVGRFHLHHHHVGEQSDGERHRLALVGGGIDHVARLLEHVGREEPPGFVGSDQENPAVLSGGRAAIAAAAAGSGQTVMLPAIHESPFPRKTEAARCG